MGSLTADAAAALRAAGSQSLTGAARAELERRMARAGYDPTRHNFGAIKAGGKGAGDALASYPDDAAGARALVRLSRIAGGANALGPAPDQLAGFVSIAPEEGQPPIEITHLSGIARSIGGTEDQARTLVERWRNLTPCDRKKAHGVMLDGLRQRGVSEAQATEVATNVATLCDGAVGAVSKGKKRRRPPPASVVHAHHQARGARSTAQHHRSRQQQLAEQLAARRQQAQQQGASADNQAQQNDQGQPGDQGDPAQAQQLADLQAQLANLQSQGQGQGADPQQLADLQAQLADLQSQGQSQNSDPQLADLQAQLADLQSQGDQLDAQATDAEGFASKISDLGGWGGPSDASEKAFQDLAATWTAIERYQDAPKLPGWKDTHDGPEGWIAFAKAWRAGDDDDKACNGSCEDGINARIIDARRILQDLKAKDSKWAEKIVVPSEVSFDARHPTATAAEKGIVNPLLAYVPGLDRLTNPATGLLTGNAPKWQYAIAGSVLLTAIAGTIAGVVAVARATTPKLPTP